jgi:hypothetical protein
MPLAGAALFMRNAAIKVPPGVRMTEDIIEGFSKEYSRYKTMGLKALAQVPDSRLHEIVGPEGNSIAILVQHISGNLVSRFTDFLTSDGEKPWRDRDSEFDAIDNSRKDLEQMWAKGWGVLEDQLARLTDQDLLHQVFIRGEAWSVHGALARSLAHVSYHVGQMVTLGRILCSSEWQWITIPKGKSHEFNQNPGKSKTTGDKVP